MSEEQKREIEATQEAEAAEAVEAAGAVGPAQLDEGSADSAEPSPKAKKPRNKRKIITAAVVVVAVIGIAGGAFWAWHETPGFCAAICHNMDDYLTGYNQEQAVAGTDKWGNEVTNTNAMMSVLHRANDTTAKSEIVCLDCHHAVLGEQITEGAEFITGNYYDKLNERVGDGLTAWWNEDQDRFCANENCHVYLQGENGAVNREKLEAVTAAKYGTYNPHSTYHSTIDMSCTSCHKGHRASVVSCTACHENEFSIPDGWVTYQQSQEYIQARFGNAS